ncbi:MAG: hypothetical protein ACFFER_08550 [Candidatus Thorarchaeota archaeon]
MGKGMALLGLILIIIGLLPVIFDLVGFSYPMITDLFNMLGPAFSIELGMYVFTDIMLILIILGVLILIIGATR